MLIQRLKVSGLLSFGPKGIDLPLEPLNVLIGPNGSGKSNLLDAISLLPAAPKDLEASIVNAGGISDWIWRGEPAVSTGTVEAIVRYPKGRQPLRYALGVREHHQRFEVVEERIERERPDREHQPKPYFYYEYANGHAVLNHRNAGQRSLRPETVHPQQSVLSQRKDEDEYPELFWLGRQFGRVRLYRKWAMGRHAPARLPQKTDLRRDFLDEDARNLCMVLNRLKLEPPAKKRLLKYLGRLYEGVTDVDVSVEGSTAQVFVEEGDTTVPATRLSDGTMRYLCLLVVLLHPDPPPLVCIEEPELGLHPDLLPTVSDLLREASKRSQLVITTHSDLLVDCLTDQPESVVICEKHRGETQLRRLDGPRLAQWLEKYTLGPLWTRGKLGGNRW